MNEVIHFRGTRMEVKLASSETGDSYAMIEMTHPADVGPALHIHTRGPESFYVLEGEYTFIRGDERIVATAGDALTVPAGVPHRYLTGPYGGRVLVVLPPGLDDYFRRVAAQLASGSVTLEEEFRVAAECGQEFLDRAGHWGATRP